MNELSLDNIISLLVEKNILRADVAKIILRIDKSISDEQDLLRDYNCKPTSFFKELVRLAGYEINLDSDFDDETVYHLTEH